MSSVFFLTLGYSSSKGGKIPTGFLGHQYTLIFTLSWEPTSIAILLISFAQLFEFLHGAFNPNFEIFSPKSFGHIKVNFLIRYYSTHGIVVTTFVNSFTNSFLVICSDGLVICCGWLELMWARYSFEWFRLVFTRALIPCLTLRVLPQLTWIEEFPLVCSPILVLYPHTSRASITLQLLKVPLHHSKCVFLHVSCCCSNVRDQARAPSYPYSSNQLTSKHECSKLNKR